MLSARCVAEQTGPQKPPRRSLRWVEPAAHRDESALFDRIALPAHLRKVFSQLSEFFWILPAALTLLGIVGAVGLVSVDRSGTVPHWLLESTWVYNGGGTGARTLLGAIAASTIGVAGTVFSITIAALSLAAGQMGPRLLRNFTRDRGVQITLGTFLGTFSYALMVLRSVRTQDEGVFTPHVSLTVSILLAFLCVGTLIYFVGHMAGRINVDTVVELVSNDMRSAIKRLTTDARGPMPAAGEFWADAVAVCDSRHGYLQELDAEGLADWAASQGVAIHLLVRPGDYVFPGAPIALVKPLHAGAAAAIGDATALGASRVSADDLAYPLRHLVEVAVRALSAGINDPNTAMSVLDRLASSLCELAPRFLPSGVYLRNGITALDVPSIDYDCVVDAMFHMIRQNAAGNVAVLIRMLEVLGAVASVEHDPQRASALQRHADLVLADASRDVSTHLDLAELRRRHVAFERIKVNEDLGLPRVATVTPRGIAPHR